MADSNDAPAIVSAPDSLRHMTIAQCHTTTFAHYQRKETAHLNGQPLNNVKLVATICWVFARDPEKIRYELDDGTGSITTTFFRDKYLEGYYFGHDKSDQELVNKFYVRVTGQLEHYQGKCQLRAAHISLVEDYHEVIYHNLQVIWDDIAARKGPPPCGSSAGAATASTVTAPAQVTSRIPERVPEEEALDDENDTLSQPSVLFASSFPTPPVTPAHRLRQASVITVSDSTPPPPNPVTPTRIRKTKNSRPTQHFSHSDSESDERPRQSVNKKGRGTQDDPLLVPSDHDEGSDMSIEMLPPETPKHTVRYERHAIPGGMKLRPETTPKQKDNKTPKRKGKEAETPRLSANTKGKQRASAPYPTEDRPAGRSVKASGSKRSYIYDPFEHMSYLEREVYLLILKEEAVKLYPRLSEEDEGGDDLSKYGVSRKAILAEFARKQYTKTQIGDALKQLMHDAHITETLENCYVTEQGWKTTSGIVG
ncbi:hypothetical protein CYLTODRAFT_418142 [Cylindrobasidium torrendii FP15055 ss-10]|uniref:OB domain-containing protein n=1 Tax=Cylindrobasidium torrendii FP15055 ss-10 TaxID=1314674 RepID=A0A0D7BPP6_9AGAR|nr:hypothetical protein CYLTODRAFT_418142 [Cylindrobasidium torrendii FP15055 ss-10]